MEGIGKKLRKLPTQASGLNAFRVMVILAFAALGAYLMYAVAPVVLGFLFRTMSNAIGSRASEDAYTATSVATTVPLSILGALLGGFAGVRIYNALERVIGRWDKMEVGDKVTLFVGVFAGFVASVPFLLLFQALQIPSFYSGLATAGLILFLSSLSVYALQSMAEILPWNRGRGRGKRSGYKILDTNVIIDGRIYDVAKTGFLEGRLYLPGFVLDELQYIADSHEPLRRQRGRRGLDLLRLLQADFDIAVREHDRLAPDQKDGVDARLVRLAKALGADLLTNDSNLNRVAVLQDVNVLNVNDLALALRPNVLPQETLMLTLIREGNQMNQGVGYLDDGTMVVVENGKPHVGETMEVTVTQVIQTERGKMIFAQVPEDDEGGGGGEAAIPRRRPVTPGGRKHHLP